MNEEEENFIKNMIEKLKMSNSVQDETIKENLKLVINKAYNKGYENAMREEYTFLTDLDPELCSHDKFIDDRIFELANKIYKLSKEKFKLHK